MSGLVNGLQNRQRRFESARHLHKRSPAAAKVVAGLAFTDNVTKSPPKDSDNPNRKNSLQKMYPQKGESGIGAWEVVQRRTRELQSPHAAFAISPREVHYRLMRNLAIFLAEFNISALRTCIFFATQLKTTFPKPRIIKGNAF